MIHEVIPVQTATEQSRETFRIPVWLGTSLFLAIAAFFLLEEHRAHILGVLPYAILLLCPVIHLFMHRGHGSHGDGHPTHERRHGRDEGKMS